MRAAVGGGRAVHVCPVLTPRRTCRSRRAELQSQRRERAKAARKRQWQQAGYKSLALPLPDEEEAVVDLTGGPGSPSPAKPSSMRRLRCERA